MTFELTKEYLLLLENAIDQRNDYWICAEMDELFPEDISAILYELEGEQAHYILGLLDKPTGAEIITNLDESIRTSFLNFFTTPALADYIDLIDSDDAVDILSEQSVQRREEVIAYLKDREQARFILDLLHYDPEVAGGLMQKELVKINVKQTVTECVEEIRKQAEDMDDVYAVYVVDDDQILLGIVSLKKIILAKRGSKIADIFEDDIHYVHTYTPAETVAETMQHYDLAVIPVVNVQGRLLGRITIDDIVDVIVEQDEEDRMAMSGISEYVEEDDSVWKLTRARLPWLLIGMAGSLLAARFIGFFENDLSVLPAIAAFIPLIGSTGGNVGIQSSSIILQSLANRTGLDASLAQRLFKVLLVALINGCLIGLVVFAFNFAIGQEIRLSLVVSAALLSVTLLASLTGTITPLLLDRFGLNPAVASGPFITTANDLIGIGVYLLIIHIFI